ncbi:MAG TPA: VTT domain-containing protein, partial [Thermodesulfobacteriota bacterium]|nr:VTT domain-containing protein [Thermodesulfobacteriota bacterium]
AAAPGRSAGPPVVRRDGGSVQGHRAVLPAEAPIAVEGRNCWRRLPARRVACLVDGAAYFEAFRAAALRARRQILVLGWDINSRACLAPGRPAGRWPAELGPFLDTLVRRRRGLRVYALGWDYAMLFVLEREFLPVVKLDWRTHRRMRFRLDGNHPFGASHHQKVVVVDDAVAFVGGLDLTIERWDTPAHLADDPRRVTPRGTPYPPFHDVQLAVDGAAAAALGELARERWWRATGQRLAPPGRAGDPWPPALAPDFTDVAVAIARTEPEWDGRLAVREVEALFLDAIAAARRWIYMEQQYVSAARIGDALAARLGESGGPEVVLVVPRNASGWLEEAAMGVARARLLRRLRAADRGGRLAVYYPVVPGPAGLRVTVHSKVLVVDDVHLRVGSANASNRSMGLDTECDLAIDAAGEVRIARAIAGVRDRLLAEHLGVPVEAVSGTLAATGSLVQTVERLRGRSRTLVPLEDEPAGVLEELLPEGSLLDPERPLSAARLAGMFAPALPRHRLCRAALVRRLLVGLLLIGALASGVAWLRGRVEPADLLATVAALRGSPAAPLAVAAAYVVAGVAVALPLLVAATGLVFGPLYGVAYALLGVFANAAVFYGLGRLVGPAAARRLAGRWADRVGQALARHGVATVTTLRVVPLAPFTVVNVLAGALRIPLRDYLLGTLLGTAPGAIVLAALGDRAGAVIRSPGPITALALGGAGVLLIGALVWSRRRTRPS